MDATLSTTTMLPDVSAPTVADMSLTCADFPVMKIPGVISWRSFVAAIASIGYAPGVMFLPRTPLLMLKNTSMMITMKKLLK